MFWLLVWACGGGSLVERCEEADAYLNLPDDHGNVEADYDLAEAGHPDCEDAGESGCDDFNDATDQIAECEDECEKVYDSACIDVCLDMPDQGTEAHAAQSQCLFGCETWECPE